MAKKKSKKTKFPDRGFATTSIPKKVVVNEAEKAKEEERKKKEQLELEKKKEMERLQKEKEEKEAELQRIEMEKKKKEQEIKSHDSIGEVKASNILKLMSLNCHEADKIPGFRLNNVAEKKLLDFAMANRVEDNKVPLKKLTEQDLYSNYLVLMKLGFKDEHIQEAFLKAESFSIDSLLEWLYLSLEAEDIPLNIRGEIKMLNDVNVNISLTANEKKPVKKSETTEKQEQNKNTKSTPPKIQKVETPKVESKPALKAPEKNTIDSKLKNTILNSYMYYSDDEEEEDELINVNETFAKLQLQIDKQTKLIKKAKSNNNHGLAANLQNSNRGIRKEMEKLKESSLFDINKVNAIIREISRAAREKREAKEKNEEKEDEVEEQIEENENKNEEDNENEDEDGMGIFGMFDAEEDDNAQSNSQNSVVKMELLDVKYKSWSGKSPYKLAEDTLKKRVGSKGKLIFEIVRKTPGYQGRIKIQCQDQSLNKKVIEDDYYYFETIEEAKNYLGVKLLYVMNPNLNFNTLVPIPFRDFVGKWESKK
ncbi:hypothetical protein PIROE2DRAFT_4981, partial [Piromyces sp. E2]